MKKLLTTLLTLTLLSFTNQASAEWLPSWMGGESNVSANEGIIKSCNPFHIFMEADKDVVAASGGRLGACNSQHIQLYYDAEFRLITAEKMVNDFCDTKHALYNIEAYMWKQLRQYRLLLIQQSEYKTLHKVIMGYHDAFEEMEQFMIEKQRKKDNKGKADSRVKYPIQHYSKSGSIDEYVSSLQYDRGKCDVNDSERRVDKVSNRILKDGVLSARRILVEYSMYTDNGMLNDIKRQIKESKSEQ